MSRLLIISSRSNGKRLQSREGNTLSLKRQEALLHLHGTRKKAASVPSSRCTHHNDDQEVGREAPGRCNRWLQEDERAAWSGLHTHQTSPHNNL